MSIDNARRFIGTALKDKQLRDGVNSASSTEEVTAFLESKNFSFTYSEFDEALSNLLTQCKSEENANMLKEFKMWWDMTLSITQ
jgi:hypothetical protein